ncbi:phage tail tape measure protein [Sodalis glossinidius]|uniref:phage tail tape measure protein n=1 Tax=Sodalis glossinidius TaxID=63612 RepID=UPI0002F77E4F|nr:phage tail tape measure protein [Sodalis glossinidius]
MARHQLTYTRTQALAKAQAESAAAPRLSLAGEIDPVVALQNQLVRQQSLLDAYYANGSLSKTQYEALMQKTAQDSADAQYQAALALYGGQSRLHKLSLSLAETLRERTTNMLTGARSFKESLSGLFASLAQSVIKNLVDTAAQALITKTLFSSFMGGFGGGGRSAANAFSSGAYNGLSLNAKGGVYASRSLSAFSGQVVSQPTLFAFSHGAGLMGESGPEAIMPLKRGPDGSLGVQAVDGGGRGGDVIVNMGGFVFTTDERSDSAAGAGDGC